MKSEKYGGRWIQSIKLISTEIIFLFMQHDSSILNNNNTKSQNLKICQNISVIQPLNFFTYTAFCSKLFTIGHFQASAYWRLIYKQRHQYLVYILFYVFLSSSQIAQSTLSSSWSQIPHNYHYPHRGEQNLICKISLASEYSQFEGPKDHLFNLPVKIW